MELILEKINKNLLFIALLSLIFRKGNFYNSFIPKPFEIIFVLLLILTIIYLIRDKKFLDFFYSVPKKIRIALFCLFSSVFLGWFWGVFVRDIPLSFNMILEFGTLVISLGIFLLVLFYTKCDENYTKKYFYALLLPVLYIIFILFPNPYNSYFFAPDGNFLGLTLNPNIISKILLIPSIFFIVNSLSELKNKWLKSGYVLVSSALVALLFWISSRGSLLSLAFAVIFIWLVFILKDFSWKKLLNSGLIILIIFSIGFVMTPYARKQMALNRILNPDNKQDSVYVLKGKTLTKIIQESIGKFNVEDNFVVTKSITKIQSFSSSDSRLQIWSFFLKYVFKNPLGIGPNTHMKSSIVNINGEEVSSGPHCAYLQIWLWGGLLGLFSFFYILFSVFRNLWFKIRYNFNTNTLIFFGILFALSISIMFDDSISFFWFWIILALSLREGLKE